MTQFWQQESFIWGAILILGFPLLTLWLGEVTYRAKDTQDKYVVTTLKIVQNLIFPSLALFILLNKIIGLPKQQTPLQLVQTGLWIFTIHAALTLVNGMLFGSAKAGSWQANVPRLFRDLSRFFLILLGVAIVLSVVWGADLGGLVAALGVGSIVLGLALQDTLGNLFSGIALLFERPFTEGDWLEVSGIKGKVIEINWRSVHLLTRELEMLIIPNAILAKEVLRNYRRPQRMHVEAIEVGFSYDDPPNKVKQVMKETALATKGVLEKPEPIIQTISYDDSSIGYVVKLFLADYDRVPQIRDEFVTRVWYAANRNGLNIPFPIRTLYHNHPTKVKPDELLDEFVAYISTFPCFVNLDRPILDELVSDASLKYFAEGEKIITQGYEDEGLYLVIAGKASIKIRDRNNREHQIIDVSQGEFFGEMTLTDNRLSPVNVNAIRDLKVIILKTETMQSVLDRTPRLRRDIGAVIESRRQAIAKARRIYSSNGKNSNGNSSL